MEGDLLCMWGRWTPKLAEFGVDDGDAVMYVQNFNSSNVLFTNFIPLLFTN